MDFATALKTIRKEKGYTQSSLAKELKVSQNAVYNWESKRCEPNIDTIKEIARILKVPVIELVGSEVSHQIDLVDRVNAYMDFIHSIEPDEEDLVKIYRFLNITGKKEAKKRVQELTEIEKYRKKEDSQGTNSTPV